VQFHIPEAPTAIFVRVESEELGLTRYGIVPSHFGDKVTEESGNKRSFPCARYESIQKSGGVIPRILKFVSI
jgi:hypothetical protein